MSHFTNHEKNEEVRRVFLFSGHMIDHPDRKAERFPARAESIAAQAIQTQLEKLTAGPTDLAICSGACGGDILFAEAALQRGMQVRIMLPFPIRQFLPDSVAFAGPDWPERFERLRCHERVDLQIMPDELENAAGESNPYARANRWMLASALAFGAQNVHLICLWNCEKSTSPGGTFDMYEDAKKNQVPIIILNTRELFNIPA